MTFQVDVIPEYTSLFFEITWSLEICRWFLSRMSFIVTLALVLFIQRICVGPYKLENIS